MTTNDDHLWHNKLIEQYLNIFFREKTLDIVTMIFVPTENPVLDVLGITDEAPGFTYHFSASESVLYGSVNHISLSGHHRYGQRFLLKKVQTGQIGELRDVQTLLRLISEQLAFDNGQHTKHVEAAALLYEKMYNSVSKTLRFLRAQKHRTGFSAAENFIAAEQGMMLGHPFHVTPKANIGFSAKDMQRYSPELGASFKLHYFAVVPELLKNLSSGTDLSRLLDPIARQEAEYVLGEKAERYGLLPCHPWQARFLLGKPEIKDKLQSQDIVPLGPMGQIVWPTSSIRTVWMPKTGFFLKLSLDVRITNFIRNNPPEHVMRAIDASRLINSIGKDEIDDTLRLLPELAAQTVEIPGLEASFAIIYRDGLKAEALAQTRILGSLAEECFTTGEAPLFHFIRQAAQTAKTEMTASFVSDWWQEYVKASLLPTLKLFAQRGVNLEAHLQNSLMRFNHGMPVQLVVRDMEGTGVLTDSVLAKRCPEVASDSPVWYSADKAWFRFKYYVVVNHIAHLIAVIARSNIISEANLWKITGQTLFDAKLPEQARVYAHRLLRTRHLPAKANMLSTLQNCGEKPAWVEIPNPLCTYRYTDLVPLTEIDAETAYGKAEQRVVTQLLESLLFEGVLPYRMEQDRLLIPVTAMLSYRCRAQFSFGFSRLRIQQDSLRRWNAEQATGRPSLKQLMQEILPVIEADAESWQSFHDELTQTLTKHAQALQSPPSQTLRDMSYFEQEARICNGHLYHPSFKSRLGFDLNENLHYGPELSTGYHVVWIAVDQTLTHSGVSHSTSLDAIYRQHFSVAEYRAIKQQIRAANAEPDRMFLLPVHPWQWYRIIRTYYQDLISRKRIIELDVKGPNYLPQQSIRTLSNLDDLCAPSLKLALSVVNTSTARVLAPHTVQNAARISDWLWELVQNDDLLPEAHKPIILREIAGLGVNPPLPLQPQYGALACIWRESVYHYLTERQSATPITALTQLDIDRRPLIEPWIKRHGIQSWVAALVEHVYLPVMHMLWRHGTALESHAQNMLLIHEDGMPLKVALKDFHDGVRYSPALLGDPAALPELIEAPTAHARVNPSSFLETHDPQELRDFTQDALCFVNQAELAWFLNDHYGFAESDFWALARQIVLRYQAAHPDLAERFTQFDFLAAEIDIEQLASRRFLPEIRLRVKPASNPLSAVG